MRISDYKFSNYNKVLKIDNDYYFFNSITGGFGKLNEKYHSIFCCNKFNMEEQLELIRKDDEIINKLIQGNMLIHSKLNELSYLKGLHNIYRFQRHNVLGLTIAPTLDCNFRCPYCYEKEKDYPKGGMTKEVMDKVVEFIDLKLENKGHLTLNWYGGEPLLEVEKVLELQESINSLAKDKNIDQMIGMITNGFLLTKDISDKLFTVGLRSLQVTIDGDRKTHDNRRKHINGEETFEKILDNIMLVNDEIRISIRVNIDRNNVSSIEDLLDHLCNRGIQKRKNITVYFSIVRNQICSFYNYCYSQKEYADEEVKLYNLLLEKGFPLPREPRANIASCGAISPFSFLIQPDGGLQKCWNTIGDNNELVGHLLDNDNKEKFIANLYKWYAWSPFDREKCEKCSILPICMGSCPYESISNKDERNCDPYKFNINKMLELLVKVKMQCKMDDNKKAKMEA